MKEAVWQVKATQIDPAHYFGITVANGMIGLVSDARPMHIKDVVLNGVYDRYQRGRVSNILKGFNPVNVDLAVNDQMLTAENIINFSQELDMKEAVLVTTFEKPGELSVRHEVVALRSLPYTALVNIEVTAHEALELKLFNNLEAPDHLRDVKNFYSEIDRPHVKIPLLTSVANSPSGNLTLAASNSYIFEEPHGDQPQLIHEDWDFNRHLIKFSKHLKPGQTYRFSIVSSICTSAHFTDPQNEAERLSIFAKLEGRQRLMERHQKEWAKLWQNDIEIEGDPQVQREIRMMLYHLYSFARAGTALSLSPVGLSGLGYNGHVFWDTELWMYPPLLVMQPDIAAVCSIIALSAWKLLVRMPFRTDTRALCSLGKCG